MSRIVSIVLLGTLLAACSSSDSEPDRIGRIDGPAQVDDDVNPVQVDE